MTFAAMTDGGSPAMHAGQRQLVGRLGRLGRLGRIEVGARAVAQWDRYQAGTIWRSSHSPGSSRGRMSAARPSRTATSGGIGCDRKSGIDSVKP